MGETDTNTAIRHLIYSAIPAAVAALVTLTDVLTGWSTGHRAPVYAIVGLLGCATLAAWLWCGIDCLRRTMNTIRRQQDRAIAIAERNEKSVQSAHRKLDQQALRLERDLGDESAIVEEVRHLRRLVMDRDPSAGIGPSPYS